MPKGDGQGRNNRRPGRPANELGPLDLLLERLKIHRECAAGRQESGEWPEYHARMAESVSAEIDKLTEANGGWKLEVMESSERLKEAIAAWTTEGHEDELAVAQLDIDERLLNALDARGVIWLRDLLRWTEPMILALPSVSHSLLRDLKDRLAERGLKLRQARAHEEPVLPPVKYRLTRENEAKRGAGRKKLSQTTIKRKAILHGLADGATCNAIGEQLKMGRQTVINFRSEMRSRVRNGEHPLEIAKRLGFVHSPLRTRVVTYLTMLAQNAVD